MSSGRFAEVRTPLILSILMVLMTQVGYLDLMNAWSGDEETLDETNDVLETGGSSFAYANDKLSGADRHTCAILDNGDLKCWGYDGQGQLGDGGTNTDTNAPSSTAIDLGIGRTAVSVVSGDWHTCAILDNDDMKCWGRGTNGRLGNGGTSDKTTPIATNTLGSGRTAVDISAGAAHTCAVLDNGDLKCWGSDTYGQLGTGQGYGYSGTAIDLGTGRTAVAVSAGHEHTCAILDTGDLKCWGWNNFGQAGGQCLVTECYTPSSTAIDLGTGRTAVAVSNGEGHTCAILDNGDLKCWGRNTQGQLGDGTNTNTNAPSSTAINLGTGRTAVAVSTGDYHTCAILDNGDMKCWGYALYGQLGDGGSISMNLNAPSSSAIDLGTGRTAVAVSAGSLHTCAILDNGEAKCWGWNDRGQLGDGGSNTNQGLPVTVSGSNTWDSSTVASSGSGGGSGGASQSNFTASIEGADLIIDEAMTNITFQYNASAASGSGSGSGSGTTNGNGTTWQANDINSGYLDGQCMKDEILVGDTLYFCAYDASSGFELWAHDTSNASTWQVADINSGTGHSLPGQWMSILVGDTLYFSANDGSSGTELWAHDTSNASTWRVADINSGSGNSYPGQYM
jgi:ELWxxDGT repeat protein